MCKVNKKKDIATHSAGYFWTAHVFCADCNKKAQAMSPALFVALWYVGLLPIEDNLTALT